MFQYTALNHIIYPLQKNYYKIKIKKTMELFQFEHYEGITVLLTHM